MPKKKRSASGLPVKRFFIDILVRDIELLPAILDLVDNSVDSARQLRKSKSLDGLHVALVVAPDRFEISDNCAGIALEVAEKYAFRFGRPDEAPPTPGSVGQFGVGMKRALFKIGRAFKVESSTLDHKFVVATNVREWVKDLDDWDFPIDLIETGKDSKRATGTAIEVSDLHESVREDFELVTTISELREQLRIRHRESLARGLEITLNAQKIVAADVAIVQSQEIEARVDTFNIPTPHGDVSVRIIAGVGATSKDPDESPESVKEAERAAGWYVFCNDRLLLNADRSPVTGWGSYSGLPLYHNQFARFRGFVYLEAANASALPWNTSKTGVDGDSPTWKRVRTSMIAAGRPVIDLLNDLKNETASSLPAAERPVTRSLEHASTVAISSYRASSEQPLKRPPAAKIPKRTNRKRIAFSVEPDRFKRVSAYLNEKDATRIGETIFEYYYSNQIDEDD